MSNSLLHGLSCVFLFKLCVSLPPCILSSKRCWKFSSALWRTSSWLYIFLQSKHITTTEVLNRPYLMSETFSWVYILSFRLRRRRMAFSTFLVLRSFLFTCLYTAVNKIAVISFTSGHSEQTCKGNWTRSRDGLEWFKSNRLKQRWRYKEETEWPSLLLCTDFSNRICFCFSDFCTVIDLISFRKFQEWNEMTVECQESQRYISSSNVWKYLHFSSISANTEFEIQPTSLWNCTPKNCVLTHF